METSERKVILVPFPFQGHLTPMLQLGTVLHTRGFSIIVAHTEFNAPNPENHPEFSFVSLPDESCLNSGNMLEVIAAINTNCREPLEKKLVEEQDSGGLIGCIIYDSLMHFVEAVAQNLKLPSIFFRPTTGVYMQSYHAILSLIETPIFPLPESQLEESVPGLHPIIRYRDLPVPCSSKISQALIEFVKSFSNIRSSVAVIWNSIEVLDDQALKQLQHDKFHVPFFPIGPLHKLASSSSSSSSSSSTSLLPEDSSCIAWLDKQAPKSVLYISLGSLATMDDKALIETAMGIANSGHLFLWAIRPSSVSGSEWIECLPEGFMEAVREGRGLIVKWAPQKKVLAHPAVGGFLSHCGWNSTLESISEGVVMICRPFFGDQMINARFLIHVWRVGVELDNVVDRDSIEKAVRMVMVKDEANEMRRRALELKDELLVSMENDGCLDRSLNRLVEFITSFIVQK